MSQSIPPIGTLTDRIMLERRVENQGEAIFTPLATVWGRVRQLSPSSADAPSHSIVFRFRTDIKAGDRVTYRGRHLHLLSVNDLNGRRAYMSGMATEETINA